MIALWCLTPTGAHAVQITYGGISSATLFLTLELSE